MGIKDKVVELLWDSLKKDPEHKDRRKTGYGTKTQDGLVASIEEITKQTEATGTIAPTFNDRELATWETCEVCQKQHGVCPQTAGSSDCAAQSITLSPLEVVLLAENAGVDL